MLYETTKYKAGFLHLSTTDILDWIIFVVAGCLVWIVGWLPACLASAYPLDNSSKSILLPNLWQPGISDVCRHCQMFPGGRITPIENYSLMLTGKGVLLTFRGFRDCRVFDGWTQSTGMQWSLDGRSFREVEV